MIDWLDPNWVQFPPVEDALAEPNGLLAAGGALTPEWLLSAYRHGIFPWFNEGDPIFWWSPNPRAVFDPTRITIRKSLRQSLRNRGYVLMTDTDFKNVVIQCAKPRGDDNGTWILPSMHQAYVDLHTAGYAHSFECWHENRLVGGLYGVALGSLFFGESMFSIERDASKCALVFLAHCMNQIGGPLIDCQIPNAHLSSMGAYHMERDAFLAVLAQHKNDTPGWPSTSWSTAFPTLAGEALLNRYGQSA